MHWIVTGKTGCGKSRLIKSQIIPRAHASGRAVAVVDPLMGGVGAAGRREWGLRAGDLLTDDPAHAVDRLKASRKVVVIVDEWGFWRQKPDLSQILEWPYTIGRNYGHLCYALAQRTMMIPPSVRAMCSNAVVFKQPLADLRDLADLLDDPAVMAAGQLPEGVAIVSRPFQKPEKIRVF